MAARRVFSEFRNLHHERLSTEEFIQRCKTTNDQGISGTGHQNNFQQGKYDMTPSVLEHSAIKTFISLLSDIATKCQSLEDQIKVLQNQVTSLERTVQDLRSSGKSNPESLAWTSSALNESSAGLAKDINPQITTELATSSSSSTTDHDLKEKLQRLQWKTFDIHRQNELLRRMLEIQCTVNENAAASHAAADKKKDKTTTNDSEASSRTIQQADSTSNSGNTTQTSPRQYTHTRASSTMSGADPTLHEEYVPLSAQEMLSQSFVDPKVPWSANTGSTDTKDTLDSSKSQEPNINYAYVYAPCSKTGLLRSPHRKVAFSSNVITPPKHDLFTWERKREEDQGD